MSREKQIEEMAKTMVDSNNKEVTDALSLFFATLAEALYKAGYRKQIEAENVAMYPTSAFECSLCGWSNWDLATGDGIYKYCPNCGAKMKGGE